MTPEERQNRAAQRRTDLRTIGQRIRQRRLETGHTVKSTAQAVGISENQLQVYEVGNGACPARLFPAIAAAMGVPIASLLVDELVLAEIRLSPETLERIKREGRPAAIAAVDRIRENLIALALAEATRPPIDLSPGARGRPRRSREQVLAANQASWAAASEKSKVIAEQRRQARRIA